MLMEFVTHENRPISNGCSYSYGRLLNSEFVNSTDLMEPIVEEVELRVSRIFSKSDIPEKVYRRITKQYCLVDGFYKALKYSYEKYGKISHFKK